MLDTLAELLRSLANKVEDLSELVKNIKRCISEKVKMDKWYFAFLGVYSDDDVYVWGGHIILPDKEHYFKLRQIIQEVNKDLKKAGSKWKLAISKYPEKL